MSRFLGYCSGVFFVVYFTLVTGSGPEADIETLQLVQVIFRHGDRAPTNSYPNDPVNDIPNAWPEGIAQLTSVGKMQQYNLGQYLRRRYRGFLSEKYHASEIYAMSSDMDRTIMSVESNLAGMYPPVHKWHPHLDWQPIPLRTVPWKEDRYLHVNTECPRYTKIHKDFMHNSEEVRLLNEENMEFVLHLAEKSGLRATTVKEIISLQDIILTETIHNLTVPDWAKEALPKLNQLSAITNTWSTFTEEMKRLHGGPLLDLLIKNMLAKTGRLQASMEEKRMVVGSGPRKMLLYSAHDSTLSRIMNTIGVFHPHNPPYASALMLELHWNEDDHIVKIFYRNDTTRHPYELQIPSCPSPCVLSDLINGVHHLIPKDVDEECEHDLDNGDGHLLKSSAPGYIGRNNPVNNPPIICPQLTQPDPIIVAAVGSVLFASSIFLWACLCKFLGCCGRRDKSSFEEKTKLLPFRKVYVEPIA